MGATRKPGLKRDRMAAHLKTLPQIPEGESSMALETGHLVAWVFRDAQDRMTTGVSHAHRVFDRASTYCGNAIPPELRRFPPLASLNPCSTCERLYARAKEREEAAELQRVRA